MKKKAVALAILTTVLWSGSYILNKIAFAEGIRPLTLSGLRYLLAALLLLGIRPRGGNKPARAEPRLSPWLLLTLGLLGYAVAQGFQYIGQSYLTPIQSSLCLSVGNTLCVILADRLWLRENQRVSDMMRLFLLVGGIALYYFPWGGESFSGAGVLWMGLSSVGYAVHMTFNRRLRAQGKADARTLTGLPMLVGAVALLAVALPTEGLPVFSWRLVLILVYLAGISGALGFWLWTYSQAELTAFESSGINNLMLVEIALLDWLVFGRTFSALQLVAIALVFGTILSMQVGKRKSRTQETETQ
ncbi:MAG: DMT family transporter [Eubacteriales bacterium]|nr:DMT family transporter [Eubacteriales bacterium]